MLFRCHYNEEGDYPSYEEMSRHLNKTSNKVSFVGIRDNVGCTSFASRNPSDDMQHSFGVPRYFFRLNLTSSICNQPYGYVNWSVFKMSDCYRTSFQGSLTRREWTTGPVERPRINPFCYLEDVIPSRFALGFDEDSLNVHFMALDPERVGIENIEVPQICDFGDNVLDYMTRVGHSSKDSTTLEVQNEDEDDLYDRPDTDAASESGHSFDEDDSDMDTTCSSLTDDSYTNEAESIPELSWCMMS